MRIKTIILSVCALTFFLLAGTGKAGLTEGNQKGDIAPGIESLKTDVDITFSKSSGSYTLLHFWTAYDAGSRMLNVQLWNRLNKDDLSQVKMISVSLDKQESIFTETVKTDRLEATSQIHEALGERSEVYEKYGLKKGLKNFLIDDKGVIVAINVTPEKLSEIIK